MKRKAMIALLLAAILMVSALPLSALADTAFKGTATINASWLRYRQSPSVNSPSYAQEARGTKVTITKRSTMGWWYYCTGPSGSGWMYYKYLSNISSGTAAVTAVPGAKAGSKYVISNKGLYVNLRSSAAVGNNVIAQLKDGATVTMVSYGSIWSQVKVNNQVGYVMTCKLKAK